MGIKDVPSFIDFILAKTGLETLSYIGHSQGTTQMFLAASMNPDYFTEKINVFVALAPVASTQYLKIKSLRAAANHIHLCTFLLTDVLSYYSWFAPMYLGSEAIDAFCLIEKDLCRNFMSHLLNPALDNVDRFEMGVSDLPAGQTYRAMVYYAQSIREDYRFSLYNYGTIENRRIYGSPDPPAVPLQDYKLPTVF